VHPRQRGSPRRIPVPAGLPLPQRLRPQGSVAESGPLALRLSQVPTGFVTAPVALGPAPAKVDGLPSIAFLVSAPPHSGRSSWRRLARANPRRRAGASPRFRSAATARKPPGAVPAASRKQGGTAPRDLSRDSPQGHASAADGSVRLKLPVPLAGHPEAASTRAVTLATMPPLPLKAA
jgi:hypothetical protein